MEAIVGPEPGKIVAEALTRVLDLAFDEGHPDPRHSEHWWDWRDWPFDGRQWTYDGSINRYKLDKKINAEWERRQNFPPNSGMEGSDLRVERKLEGGLLWGEKKFPIGRTSIRSSARTMCPPQTGIDQFMIELLTEAADLDKRSSYDTAIKRDKPNKGLPFKEGFSQEVEAVLGKNCEVLMMQYFGCTDAFATRGEQNGEGNVPSLLIGAKVLYETSPGVLKNVMVVAEIPMRPMGMTMFVETSHDRIAGFVFSNGGVEESTSRNDVNVTYVESCQYDLDTLDHNEKDALLEDRALIVHRFLENLLKPGAAACNLLSDVSFPRYLPAVKPDAGPFPPERTLSLMTAVHRADPRWPLVKPNSVCLECGKDPTKTCGKLLHCSKCGVRKFCSSECMASSWRSDTWSHKVECSDWCEMLQSRVGRSFEDAVKEVVGEGYSEDMSSQLEQILGTTTFKEKYDSVEEMTDGLRQKAKETRKANREGKKGKKKGKKK